MARSRKESPKPAKGAKNAKAAPAPGDVTTTRGRVEQVREVWKLTRESDPKAPLYIVGPAVAVLAVLVVVGILIHHVIIFSILAVLVGVIVGTSIFGRRATGTLYRQVEGRPGAAAAILQGMRGDWKVTPAVAFTRNQDLVHRVVGRPGVILVAEGSSPVQLRQLLTDQKRRVGRVAPDTPLYDVVVGDAEGQVPIRKLQQHMMKLPRNLKKAEVSGVEARMKAIGGTSAPMPKGPIPTRMPRGKLR